MSFDYQYVTDLKPGENQYDGIYDLDEESIVEARYVRSATIPGNPFIEALPRAWSFKEIWENYNKPVPVPSVEEQMEMDIYSREDNIDLLLDQFRVLLPFHAIVENQFHRALIRSYSKRKVLEDRMIDVKLHVANDEVITHNRLEPKHMSDPVAGFTLLGSGGCGKSTGVNMMLSHYPQTIIHQRDTWQRTYQIVYLLVQCTANSNFSQLYENIGAAIDRAVGNFDPVYEQLFRKGGLHEKYTLLRDLVQKFAIGCIILDEIELMDVKSTKESSLEALLTLTNETGVAICVIGTMDAYKNLFFKARTARRMGVSIIASRYCTDRKRFGNIVDRLSTCQWGVTDDNAVVYDEKLTDALFKASNGVISDLMEIYKLIQKDQIKQLPVSGEADTERSGNAHVLKVTPEYIDAKAKEYYDILNQARTLENNRMENPNIQMISQEIMRLNSASELTDQAQMEKRYDEVMADPVLNRFIKLREAVVQSILAMKQHYRRESIERAFAIAIKNRDISSADTDQATAWTLAYLEEKKSKRNKTAQQEQEDDKGLVDAKQLQEILLKNNEEQD